MVGFARYRTAAVWIVALALAAVAILYGGVLDRAPSRAKHRVVPVNVGADVLVGPDALAAAFREALRCQTLTFAANDPEYFRAQPDRTGACRQYSPDHVVIYHEIDREFRIVLDAPNYSCPVVSLPAIVQSELGICPADG